MSEENVDNVIEVDHIRKSFKVYYDKGNQLKERLLFHNRSRYEKKEVLKDISFQVKRGEGIGLVGHNGCGKSTTLKMLTRIMSPDHGSIVIKGRVAALIELGAGFHPDMSGRENIYTNAAIFGLTKHEIDEKMEDIIAFSELEEAIDNPVRTYSSGMYMRLAFAVAINVDADVLLIDEILAVGDAAFQAKCFNRLKEIKAMGTTVVIVSHSLSQIEEICDRSIWIHEGLIKAEGVPQEVHKQYLDYVEDYRLKMAAKEVQRKKKQKEKVPEKVESTWKADVTTTVKIQSLSMYNSENVEQTIFKTGEAVRIEIGYECIEKQENPNFAIGITRSDGVLCYSTTSFREGIHLPTIEKDGVVEIMIPDLLLLPALYSIEVALLQMDGRIIDYYSRSYTFEMIDKKKEEGIIQIQHEWKMK